MKISRHHRLIVFHDRLEGLQSLSKVLCIELSIEELESEPETRRTYIRVDCVLCGLISLRLALQIE